ncbi:hypothetical protein CROQUDRAFT_93557 [Cronartium quercuum f. sp. fusiforme G11]|uniref:Uncharacterized protein n=1 Tax=Cronartium quercuum f. sp. fusiforme G11 TaxID=708437 RepID=A0A9P6NGP6_9BASI|nr:hypothetical protein CROQUDRAFT_93557 [Cronartium quercuum f. sp. fusiforme G11]
MSTTDFVEIRTLLCHAGFYNFVSVRLFLFSTSRVRSVRIRVQTQPYGYCGYLRTPVGRMLKPMTLNRTNSILIMRSTCFIGQRATSVVTGVLSLANQTLVFVHPNNLDEWTRPLTPLPNQRMQFSVPLRCRHSLYPWCYLLPLSRHWPLRRRQAKSVKLLYCPCERAHDSDQIYAATSTNIWLYDKMRCMEVYVNWWDRSRKILVTDFGMTTSRQEGHDEIFIIPTVLKASVRAVQFFVAPDHLAGGGNPVTTSKACIRLAKSASSTWDLALCTKFLVPSGISRNVRIEFVYGLVFDICSDFNSGSPTVKSPSLKLIKILQTAPKDLSLISIGDPSSVFCRSTLLPYVHLIKTIFLICHIFPPIRFSEIALTVSQFSITQCFPSLFCISVYFQSISLLLHLSSASQKNHPDCLQSAIDLTLCSRDGIITPDLVIDLSNHGKVSTPAFILSAQSSQVFDDGHSRLRTIASSGVSSPQLHLTVFCSKYHTTHLALCNTSDIGSKRLRCSEDISGASYFSDLPHKTSVVFIRINHFIQHVIIPL